MRIASACESYSVFVRYIEITYRTKISNILFSAAILNVCDASAFYTASKHSWLRLNALAYINQSINSIVIAKVTKLFQGGLNLNCCLVIIQLLSFFMLVVCRFILSLCFVFLCACFFSLSVFILSLCLCFLLCYAANNDLCIKQFGSSKNKVVKQSDRRMMRSAPFDFPKGQITVIQPISLLVSYNLTRTMFCACFTVAVGLPLSHVSNSKRNTDIYKFILQNMLVVTNKR